MSLRLGSISGARWLLVAGLIVGLAAGGIWTLAEPDRYRAETRVLLQGKAATRVAPAVKALAESSILEQNVAQTTRLSHPPEVSAAVGAGGVMKLTVEAGEPERARQIGAEAAQVLTQLVQRRFGADPGVTATVLDPAHSATQTSPHPTRNLVLGGLLGLGLAAAAAAASSRRRPVRETTIGPDPGQERRLRKRIEEVTKRELVLAKRAGELAARERAVEQRERAAEQYAEQQAATETEPAEVLQQRATLPTEPREEPQPEPSLLPRAASGAWTIEELEHIAREQRDAFPHRAEEWETYLYFLRRHATIGGSLPRAFDPLIADVFGAALDRPPRDSTA